MADFSIANPPPRSKADILQIMAGLAIDAGAIGEPILATFLMLGVRGASLPFYVRQRLVNAGCSLLAAVEGAR